ncbi:MAG: hypothetical protein GYB25_05075 [Rhodobacteraceae bacterium]|nr:hypothetical protein [Paracoccaceae bacterium]
MFRFAPKKLFTTLIAGSIAIAGMTATPARADSEDVAKVIVGIAALSIIAKALDNDDRGYVHRTRPYPDQDYYDRKHDKRYKPRPVHKYKPQHVRKTLPANCVRRHETHRGRIVFLGRQCLKNNYRHFSNLPNACRVQSQTYKGMRYGFQISCLRNHGYRMAQY